MTSFKGAGGSAACWSFFKRRKRGMWCTTRVSLEPVTGSADTSTRGSTERLGGGTLAEGADGAGAGAAIASIGAGSGLDGATEGDGRGGSGVERAAEVAAASSVEGASGALFQECCGMGSGWTGAVAVATAAGLMPPTARMESLVWQP